MLIYRDVVNLLLERNLLHVVAHRTGPGRSSANRPLRLGFNSKIYRPNGRRECARRLRRAGAA